MRSMSLSYLVINWSQDQNRNLQAAVLLEDAFNYRSVNHKFDSLSLYRYRIYSSPFVKAFFAIVVFLILLLVVVEKPSSLTKTADLRQTSPPITEFSFVEATIIEGVLLLLLTADFFIEYLLCGWKKFIKKPWLIVYAGVLFYSFCELFFVCLLNLRGTHYFRFRLILRPYFLLCKSSTIKKMLKSIMYTVPEVLSVLIMLFLHVIIFALIAMMIFPSSSISVDHKDSNDNNTRINKEGDLNFPDIITSIISLLMYLSTSNNPTVMTPAYNYARYYSAFFIFFEFIGLYCLMNMLIAIVYNRFSTYFLDSIKTSILRRRSALRACFATMSLLQDSKSNNCDAQLLFKRRNSSSAEHFRLNKNVDVDIIEGVVENAQIHPRSLKCRILRMLRSYPEESMTFDLFKNEILSLWEATNNQEIKPRYPEMNNKISFFIQKIGLSSFTVYTVQLITLLQAVILMLFLTRAVKGIFSWGKSSRCYITIANIAFLAVCILTLGVQLWGMGTKRFFFNNGRVYNLMMTIVIGFTTFIATYFCINGRNEHFNSHNNYIYFQSCRVLTILVLLKTFSLFFIIRPMRLVLTTLMDMVVHLKPYGAICLSAYYSYACFGMILFEGKIFYQISSNYLYNNVSNISNIKAPCGSFEEQNYWANNFDDFLAACVFLWNLMIVNNINVFMDVMKRYASPWSQIYIVVWWIVSNVLLVNILVALIIEVFILRWGIFNKNEILNTGGSGTYDELVAHHSYRSIYDIFRVGHDLVEPTNNEIEEYLKKHLEIESCL